MQVYTEASRADGLPRYFRQAFDITKKLRYGRIDFRLPDGRIFRADGREPGPVGICEILDDDVFARLVREGDIGFLESYMEGGWTTPDLQALMDVVHAENDDVYDGFTPLAFARAYERLRHWLRGNSKTQARRNISYHYDLGNDFYQLWLDDSMTYSSALFETGQESTEAAQRRKYEVLLDSLNLEPGQHILEIGCGWGGFAEYAAKERGMKVTGLTISQAQHDFAVERMAAAGVSDQVEIRLCDYRDMRGQFDGAASIEMFEAVGEKYWPSYFNSLQRNLKPNARATLQVITVQDKRWELYRRGVDFVQKYIFPGGMLISPSHLRQQIDQVGLQIISSREFGKSYSLTLRRWHEEFNAKWSEIAELGFDARFRRMWNVYLTACAASFEYANTDVTQITVTRPE